MKFILHASTVLTNAATKQLIDLVHENIMKNSCHNTMWKGVEDIMKLSGYTFTPTQFRGRWKTLVFSYKLVKDNNQQFGQGLEKSLENWKADQLQKLPRGILCTLVSVLSSCSDIIFKSLWSLTLKLRQIVKKILKVLGCFQCFYEILKLGNMVVTAH